MIGYKLENRLVLPFETMETNDNNVNKLKKHNKHLTLAAFTGPIPPFSELEKYEKILPGSADRIIKMAEKEQIQIHRHSMESKFISFDLRYEKLGLNYGFILAFLSLIIGLVLFLFGHDWEGVVALLIPLLKIVYSFFQGQNIDYDEDKENIDND